MCETGPCSGGYEMQASSRGYETEPQRHVMEAMTHARGKVSCSHPWISIHIHSQSRMAYVNIVP